MADKISDLKNLTKDELNLKLAALKTELFNLRCQASAGRIEKPHKVKLVRRDIARINTVLKEGEANNATGAK